MFTNDRFLLLIVACTVSIVCLITVFASTFYVLREGSFQFVRSSLPAHASTVEADARSSFRLAVRHASPVLPLMTEEENERRKIDQHQEKLHYNQQSAVRKNL